MKRMSLRVVGVGPLVLALLLSAGCGGGGGGGGGDGAVGDIGAGTVSVSVSPASATLEIGAAETLVARVSGTADARVTWRVREPGGGTVDGAGRYTAPLVPGTYHVVAESVAQPGALGEAEVTVEVGEQWLSYLNLFRSGTRAAARRGGRSGAFLPPVAEDPALSAGARAHARYLVANDTSHPAVDPAGDVHDEDPAMPLYSPEGQQAARNGNVVRSEDAGMDGARAFDAWMTGPFHALGILDPRLERVGFGLWNEADGLGWESAAVLDVLSGRADEAPEAVAFPLFFPGPDATVHLLEYPGQESPDPLAAAACAGFSPPTGLPLIVQLGSDPSGANDPDVTGTAITLDDGTPVEHCWFSEGTYTNPDGAAQARGRLVLDTRDAVVIIPREPLLPGRTYTASVTADGRTHTWTFHTWPPRAGAVALEPSPGTVLPGRGIAFRLLDADGSPPADVRWFVNGVEGGTAGAGTIAADGTYTAPGAPGAPVVVTVRGESASDPAAGAEVTFTVASVALSLAPPDPVLAPGEPRVFLATVTVAPPGALEDTAVEYLVDGVVGGSDAAGTIGPDGTYRAPAVAPPSGRVTVTARVRALPGISTSTTVAFQQAPGAGAGGGQPSLALAPDVSVTTAGARIAFSVLAGADPVTEPVRWLVNGVEGGDDTYGRVTPGGAYTAPGGPPPGPVTVRAELVSDPSRFAEVTFTVSAPRSVSIAPAEATVPLDGTETFTVSTEPPGLPVTVLVNGVEEGDIQVGTVQEDGPGTYTYHAPVLMPPAGNRITIEARLAADPAVGAAAEVSLVTEPAAITVDIAPRPGRVGLGAGVSFAATVTGAVNPNVRWFVNGVEGGAPGTGTITAAGEYRAPPLMPPGPLIVTVRAQSVADPTRFDEVSFPLMELVADPGIVRSTRAGSRHPVALTAELSDGTSVDLSRDPAVQAATDNASVATASAGPPFVTVGDRLGRTTVTFTDTGTPGSPRAGVMVVSDTDYRLEVSPTQVLGAVEGYRKPVQVLLRPQRGPQAGGAYDLAPTDAVTYEALDGNGWVRTRESPGGGLPDPTTYVAYVDAASGRVVFGRKVGTARFRVTEGQTGKSAAFTAEFLGLEVTPRVVKTTGEYETTSTGDVAVTPAGTQGFNETVVLALELRARDGQGRDVDPDTLAGLLADARAGFRVLRDEGDFIPPGLEAVWWNRGSGAVSMAEPPAVYEDREDRVAEVGVAVQTVTVTGLVPAPQIGGIVDISDTAHVLADFVPRVPGDIPVRVDLEGTVLLYQGQRLATPITFTVRGALPEPDRVLVGHTVLPPAPAGIPFFANADFSGRGAVWGLTPIMEYRLQGSGEDWRPARVLTRSVGSGVTGLGGGSGVGSQGIDGFVAAFSDPRTGTFEFRLRYAEFPDRVAHVVSSTVTLGPDGSNPAFLWLARAEDAVQDFSEGAPGPVTVCSTGSRLHIGFDASRFTLYHPDGTTEPDALVFSVTSGGEGTTGNTTQVPPNGCVQLQPQINAPAEPGDVIHGELGVWELFPTGTVGGAVEVPVLLAGSSLVATPAVQLVPAGHQGALTATWRLRGGEGFERLLGPDTSAVAQPLVRAELRRSGQAALGATVEEVTRVGAAAVDVTLTVPAGYFVTGRGSFELHLFFGSQGEAHFKAGPLDIAEVAPKGPVSTVIPLNARWPGMAEQGRVPVEVEVTGTTLPVRVAARIETSGRSTPLAGFARKRTRESGAYTFGYELPATVQRWLVGGRSARFDLFGDLTDRTSTVRDRTVDLPDGLPDRVSTSPGDTKLTIEVTQQGLARTLLEQSLTAFNFVAEHGALRAPVLAVKEGGLSRDQAYAAQAFEPDAATGEPAPPDPNAAREVWIGVDHDPEKGLGVLDMAFFPGTPDDGRWGDFIGEPTYLLPNEVPRATGSGLSPFGLTLAGVCFDPWTSGRETPNSPDLLGFTWQHPEAPLYTMSNGLLDQQGGASGGQVGSSRYQLLARTPGVDLPGLDCGYLRTGQVADLADAIAEEAVRSRSAAQGRVVTFSKDFDGRDRIRTAFHIGGPNAAFTFTTDPVDPSGRPLVEATIRAPLVLTRYPQRVRDDDIRLTTRVDAEAALKAASAKVVVSVGAAAVGALLTAAGPAGVLATAGVAAAFQIWDNQAMNPGTGKGLPDHALASVVSTAQGAVPGILSQEGLEEAFPRVWERLTVNAVLDRDTGKALLYRPGAFERIPVKKPFGVFTQTPESFRFEVSGAQLGAGFIAGVLANVINDTITPENYSANHTAHAYALDQVALVIPENAVVGDPQAGARTAWLARVTQSELDLRTARILARADARRVHRGGGATIQAAGEGRSAPFYLRVKPAFGPLVIVAVPGGQTRAAPADLGTRYPGVNPEQRNLVDFRVRVGGSDPTRFPFLTTTVVEAGRSSPQATARVLVDQSDSELALRMLDPVLESVSDGANTWSAH